MFNHVVNAGVDLKHAPFSLGVTVNGVVPNYAIYDACIAYDAPEPVENAHSYQRLIGA